MALRLDAREAGFAASFARLVADRASAAPDVERAVAQILAAVRARGDEAVRDYVERFRGDGAGELFLTGAGEPMASGNTVRVILRRIAEQLGLEKVHPHRFRHTFATWAIQSGAREIDVQMLLGHSDLAS